MTKPLLAILLLLPLSVSAGELDGKSLICDSEKFDAVNGYRFEKGSVKTDLVSGFKIVKKQNGEWDSVHGDYSIEKDSYSFDDDVYIVDRTEIRWGKTTFKTLNRQTLELVVSMKELPKLEEWQCNVYLNEADYWGRLENIRKQKQKAADEVTKDNKI